MKFVQDSEPVRWFRGRMFVKGQPVDVTDMGTITAIENDGSFRRVDDEKAVVKAPAKAVLVPPPRRSILKLRH